MRERMEMTHDLWHVLSGYGADQTGETALLLFSLAQTGGRSNLLLSLGANVQMARERGLGWIAYAWKAWRRGRQATCLAALPYEELLALPLAEVRRAAGIAEPERAHPGGIIHDDPIPT
jgi:ubiquinone biosynthesis protein COQ4